MMQFVDLSSLLSVIAGGLSAYVAIKKDIATLHIKVGHAAKAADSAHRRIDQHIHGARHDKA